MTRLSRGSTKFLHILNVAGSHQYSSELAEIGFENNHRKIHTQIVHAVMFLAL